MGPELVGWPNLDPLEPLEGVLRPLEGLRWSLPVFHKNREQHLKTLEGLRKAVEAYNIIYNIKL